MRLYEAFLGGLQRPLQTITYIMRYLTFINIALIACHSLLYPYIHYGFLSSVVMMCGLYLCYVYPRYMRVNVNGTKYTIDGGELMVVDALLHIVPWCFVMYTYGPFYGNNLIGTALFLYAYGYISYTQKWYKLRPLDIKLLWVMGTMLLAVIYLKSHET